MSRRLVAVAALLAIGSACPQVERKVYRFDIKAQTGTLHFVNIVTDSPDEADDDFLLMLDNVVEGTEIEESQPGWRITDKSLVAEGDRLDGRIAFTFDTLADAGLFKHDKKSPYVWCVPRDKDETILATNGRRIAPLPGCVVWDRKEKILEVTVKPSSMMGPGESLLPVYQRWKAGETIEPSKDGGGNPFGNLGQGADALAAGFAGAIADAMGAGATLKVGPVPDAAEGWPPMAEAGIKLCLSTASMEGTTAVQETLTFHVDPEGKARITVAPALPDTSARGQCYTEMAADLTFPSKAAPWTFEVPVSMKAAPPQ